MTSSNYPLLSVSIISYNQERYIEEAILSLLNQDYPNLEILISDDCSSDNTFNLIKKVVLSYNGPHKIIVNQNSINLGVGGNFSKNLSRASGMLVVSADGDDISLPNRVSTIYKKWSESGEKASLICSNAVTFSSDADFYNLLVPDTVSERYYGIENLLTGGIRMLGCTIAFHRDLIDQFSAINPNVIACDVVMYRRAYLKRGIMYIPDILVRYRLNSGGVSQIEGRRQLEFINHQLRWIEDRLLRYDILLQDAALMQPEKLENLKSEVRRLKNLELHERVILCGSFFKSTLYLLFKKDLSWYSMANFKEKLRIYIIRWFPYVISYKK